MEDSLDYLLQHWKIEILPGANIRAEVWRRIAARKRRLSYQMWSSAEQFLTEPIWAGITIVTLLLVGAISGSAFRAYETRRERAAGFTAYALAVNPAAHSALLRR